MLLEHPGVAQAAVIGVPDERLGQVAMAFIVPRSLEPAGLDGAAVIAWCRDRMANYKVPRFVELIDELPLTASGKVLKTALEARAAGGSG
jgi:acyl-CoA synthetase (AMP-forming)/AMP-acid ligase II